MKKQLKAKETDGSNLINVVNTSNTDEVSAFIATTFISHSYEVETTQAIVTLWDEFRNSLDLKDDLDYISAMLATGRVMDYGYEIKDLSMINTIIIDINKDIAARNFTSTDLQKELVSALIASASISRSDKVESIREIVNLWSIVKENISLTDDLDYIAGVLTIGRIMELKIQTKGFQVINDMLVSLRQELHQKAADMTIRKKELAAAFLTSAYIEISPKVEKIRDIVDTWLRICDQISVKDHWDYISTILCSGKIKDMDATHIMVHENLNDMNGKIRTEIQKIVGQ
jgi:hypothetical protein